MKTRDEKLESLDKERRALKKTNKELAVIADNLARALENELARVDELEYQLKLARQVVRDTVELFAQHPPTFSTRED